MIVDDEPVARDILCRHIEATEALELAATCINAVEAYESLQEFHIDLVFLDIQMPLLSGLEFLRSLGKPPMVIFTTAYPNYAIEGYELNVADYLLKPVTYERFLEAIRKVKQKIIHPDSGDRIEQQPDYLFIKAEGKLLKLDYEDILYLRADGNFTWFGLTDKEIFASISLKDFEETNTWPRLIRVHRSFMVNLARVDALKGNTLLTGKKEIPVGAVYKPVLLRMMGI